MFVFSVSGGFALFLFLYIYIYFITCICNGQVNQATVGECSLSGYKLGSSLAQFFGLMENKFSFKNLPNEKCNKSLLYETTVIPVQNSVFGFFNDAALYTLLSLNQFYIVLEQFSKMAFLLFCSLSSTTENKSPTPLIFTTPPK